MLCTVFNTTAEVKTNFPNGLLFFFAFFFFKIFINHYCGFHFSENNWSDYSEGQFGFGFYGFGWNCHLLLFDCGAGVFLYLYAVLYRMNGLEVHNRLMMNFSGIPCGQICNFHFAFAYKYQ